MSDQWIQRWEVPSRSDSGKSYTVGRKADGTFGCSCPAWKFAKAPKPDCDHIISIQDTFEINRAEKMPLLKMPKIQPDPPLEPPVWDVARLAWSFSDGVTVVDGRCTCKRSKPCRHLFMLARINQQSRSPIQIANNLPPITFAETQPAALPARRRLISLEDE